MIPLIFIPTSTAFLNRIRPSGTFCRIRRILQISVPDRIRGDVEIDVMARKERLTQQP